MGGAYSWDLIYGGVLTGFYGISKSKDNQTMKFDQLIKYNMRNIFLEKSCTKCSEETSQHLGFNIFWSNWTYNKNKPKNISDC